MPPYTLRFPYYLPYEPLFPPAERTDTQVTPNEPDAIGPVYRRPRRRIVERREVFHHPPVETTRPASYPLQVNKGKSIAAGVRPIKNVTKVQVPVVQTRPMHETDKFSQRLYYTPSLILSPFQ
jgi:hypothetical protein